ncbi:MAG: hypothetical protein JWN46_3935 [Acidimicrobiales bacterium]|nr:hypothetical protein [Acidimicrobiales bacterium]
MTFKRAVSLGGGLALLFSLAGCGPDPGPSSSSNPACASATAINASASLTDRRTVDLLIGNPNMMGRGVDLLPCTTSAPAGNITFRVKNVGSDDHEVIVLKTDVAFDRLPIRDAGDPPAPVKTAADKVDEGASVGETGGENLKAGETRLFTIKDMKPGRYVLVCNLAGHYTSGMRAAFQVVPV